MIEVEPKHPVYQLLSCRAAAQRQARLFNPLRCDLACTIAAERLCGWFLQLRMPLASLSETNGRLQETWAWHDVCGEYPRYCFTVLGLRAGTRDVANVGS